MKRRNLALALLVVPAVVLAQRCSAGRDRGAPVPEVAPARAAVARVPRSHYRLHFAQDVGLGGGAPTSVLVEGRWSTTPRPDGRLEVRFAPTRLDGPQESMPAPVQIPPMQLAATGGVLTAIGFPAPVAAPGRNLMTTLATTFQVSDRASGVVTEEDLLGRYEAAYQRAGEEVTRQRTGYSALRGPAGLTSDAARNVKPTEDSRFTFDDDGLVTASISYELDIANGDGLPPVSVIVHAELQRERIEMVPARFGPAFTLEPIREDIDYDAVQRSADRSMVAGASLSELLAAATGASAGQARANTLAQLAAYVRLDPSAAATIAGELRASAGDSSRVLLLAGALASAEIAAGTDALASLVAEPLPADARGTVINALQFSQPTTEASLRALGGALDGEHPDAAAVALGSHARHANRTLGDASDDAVGQLLARYATAAGDAQRILYIQALGNTGSLRALPVLRDAITSGHPQLGIAAAFALRFIPSSDADALLQSAVSDENLALAAIRAAGYRSADHWQPVLTAAQARYADNSAIQGEIRAIFRRWS